MGIVYLKPAPLNLHLLERKLGGKIINNKLVSDGLEIGRNGRCKVHASTQKTACTKLDMLMQKVQSWVEVRPVGIGTYNSKGKLQVFFPLMTDAKYLLKDIAEEILLKLGLSKGSVEPQADIIANEILCNMIREGKVVNENMVHLGLREYTKNSGFIVIDENLRNSMLDSYAKLIQEKKIEIDGRFAPVQRMVRSIKQKKDELMYGIAAALIMEGIIRLIVYVMVSMHSEDGRRKAPDSLTKHIKEDIITASELGSAMKADEPHALMVLNALELLGIVQIVDEHLWAFKKTGKTSIPNVLGMFVTSRGEAAVASSVFHQALHKDFKRSPQDEWIPERKTMDKLYKTFLKTKESS